MITRLAQMFTRREGPPDPAIPAGERVYAVGDIHGRLDLLDELISLIEADDARRGEARSMVVLLGDLIDRGPDSARVIARTRRWARRRRVEIIQGNHEEMFLASRQSTETLAAFLKFGGRETLQSYGIDPELAATAGTEEMHALMMAAVPQQDFDFIAGFRKMVRVGDYVFVHAGVRPDRPLDEQLGRDCRWIREPFLKHRGDFGAVVVHGHTISREPDLNANRIGIDTGAYLHGTLTAIGLEGTQRWFLQARDEAGRADAAAA